MKDRLLELISKIDYIETLFHSIGDIDGLVIPSCMMIGDVQEFQLWIQELKFELRSIYAQKQDDFIKEVLDDISARFDCYTDKRKFDKIKGDLLTVQRNINTYYPQESVISLEETVMSKKPKIFISHSTNDKAYVQELVSLLDGMGLTDEHVFCSSIPGYGIPLGRTIYQYLLEQFHEYDLHIIFIHSKNYYTSPVCLNEMGAAWVLKNKYTSILLPSFSFSEMKGVVDSSSIAIKLDNEEDEVKDKLNELYDQLIEEFNLNRIKATIWEKKRNSFIEKINATHSNVTLAKTFLNIPVNTKKIEVLSYEAFTMLNAISGESHREIIKLITLSGTSIKYGDCVVSDVLGYREFSKWDAAINELLDKGLIKKIGKRDEIYIITNAGYDYLERESSLT